VAGGIIVIAERSSTGIDFFRSQLLQRSETGSLKLQSRIAQ